MNPKDQVKQALRAARQHQADKEVEDTVPTVAQQDFQAQAEQEIEQTVGNDLESLLAQIDTLDPEARAVAQRHLDAATLGIKLEETTQEEVIRYTSLESELERITSQVNDLPKRIEKYSKLPSQKQQIRDIRYLADSKVINLEDAELYITATKTLSKTLEKRRFETPGHYYFFKKLKGMTLTGLVTGTSLTAINPDKWGMGLFLGCIAGPIGYHIIQEAVRELTKSAKRNESEIKIDHNKGLTKHLQKQGRKYEEARKILQRTATRIYEQLENPENISRKAAQEVEKIEIARINAREYIKNFQEILEDEP